MRIPMLAADHWSMHKIPKIIAQGMKKIERIYTHVTSLRLVYSNFECSDDAYMINKMFKTV